MFFKQTTASEVIFHDFGDDEKVLIPDETHHVTLKGLDVEIEGTGSFRRGLFLVTVIWELRPTRNVLPMFESLAQFRLPSGSNRETSDETYFDEEGYFREEFKPTENSRFLLKLQILPHPMQVFITERVEELTNFTNNFIKVLRWRTNVSGPFQLPQPGQFEWSLDKQEWHLMPELMEGRELELAELLKVDDIQNDGNYLLDAGRRRADNSDMVRSLMPFPCHLTPQSKSIKPRNAYLFIRQVSEKGGV